jgi:hypothetical protein
MGWPGARLVLRPIDGGVGDRQPAGLTGMVNGTGTVSGPTGPSGTYLGSVSLPWTRVGSGRRGAGSVGRPD